METHTLTSVACFMEDGPHARAHIHKMFLNGVLPSKVYLLQRSGSVNLKLLIKRYTPYLILNILHMFWSYKSYTFSKKLFGTNIVVNSLYKMLRRYKIKYEIVPYNTINDEHILSLLKEVDCKYIILNARGILKEPLFKIGKVFINAHKGELPYFRGSSATKWSYLIDNSMGATVHVMDEGIDTGPIIKTKQYKVPVFSEPGQIGIFEAFIVSDLLSETMRSFYTKGSIETKKQNADDGNTYFVAHPVIRKIFIDRVINKNYYSFCENFSYKEFWKEYDLFFNKLSHSNREKSKDISLLMHNLRSKKYQINKHVDFIYSIQRKYEIIWKNIWKKGNKVNVEEVSRMKFSLWLFEFLSFSKNNFVYYNTYLKISDMTLD